MALTNQGYLVLLCLDQYLHSSLATAAPVNYMSCAKHAQQEPKL
jgi:hypothetical protein